MPQRLKVLLLEELTFQLQTLYRLVHAKFLERSVVFDLNSTLSSPCKTLVLDSLRQKAMLGIAPKIERSTRVAEQKMRHSAVIRRHTRKLNAISLFRETPYGKGVQGGPRDQRVERYLAIFCL